MADERNKYIALFGGTGEEMMKMEEEERGEHMKKWGTWMKEMREKDIFIEGEPFSPESKIIAGNDMNVTDGFFAGDKEKAFGGYALIFADSMDNAIETYKGCPTFDLGGTIEVREIMKM